MANLAERAVLSDCAGNRLSADEIQARIDTVAQQLRQRFPPGAMLALMGPNSIDWVLVDLAIERAGMSVIPIAEFFAPTQIISILQRSDLLGVIHAHHWSALVESVGGTASGVIKSTELVLTIFDRAPLVSSIEQNGETYKLSFTSGSTGRPKGIRLPWTFQWQTAQAVTDELQRYRHGRRLVMLPLPVLLENVAGVYAGLLGGMEVMIPTAQNAGLTGSSQFDAAIAVDLIRNTGTDSLILLPEMLAQIVAYCQSTRTVLNELRYVAVGGAKLASGLIDRARAVGIPVYEGYGLTEAGSVVCVNTPVSDRLGSVGKPLPHVSVTTSESGELLVHLKSPVNGSEIACIHTGDLGRIDADGYVYVDGRIKNILITSYGRNISPEWVESILTDQPEIRQAVVTGDGKSSITAVLVPAAALTSDRASLFQAIERANAQLPDYARIRGFTIFDEGFCASNGLATANGRPKRDLISARFANTVEST